MQRIGVGEHTKKLGQQREFAPLFVPKTFKSIIMGISKKKFSIPATFVFASTTSGSFLWMLPYFPLYMRRFIWGRKRCFEGGVVFYFLSFWKGEKLSFLKAQKRGEFIFLGKKIYAKQSKNRDIKKILFQFKGEILVGDRGGKIHF